MKGITKRISLAALSSLMFFALIAPLLSIGTANAASFTGQWVDDSTIIIGSASGKHATYNKDGTGNYDYLPPAPTDFPITGVGSCPNTIVASSSNPGKGTITLEHWVKVPLGKTFREKCESEYGGHSQPITLTNTAAAATPHGGGGGGGASNPTCDASGFSLSWILCPIIQGAASATDGIYSNLVKPLLIVKPVDVTPPSPIYDTWSNFRVYGDIFLVIALLVIVFGESIGGGLIDAYSAKKILPRLLIAAVLINLSIYIVALALDLTNVLGSGIAALIEAPFKLSGTYDIHIGGATGDLGMAALVGGGAAGAVLAWGAFSAVLEFLLLMVVLPAFLTFVAILITVIFRQGLIILLVIVSPVAFALYCLPNTEQYFRRWWDLLFKTLLVYPLIAVLFALGNVMAVTINSTASGISGSFTAILSVVALFVPLFLIPFSFRISGGIIGRTHGVVTNARDRAYKLTEGRQQRAQQHLSRASIQRRQDLYSGIQERASRGRPTTRRALGILARGVGGYNIEARSSAARADVAKELNDQIATGKDDEIRGLWVDKRTSASRMRDGKKQFQSIGGAWIDEADVDAGKRRWGNNGFAMQAALSYEMRKADKEEDVQRIATDYGDMALSNGMSRQQAAGAWLGAAFENQDKHLEYKYTDWQTGDMSPDKAAGFVSEVYEKRGSYGMAQMHAATIDQLSHAYDVGDASTKNKVSAVAETFMTRYGGGGAVGGEDEERAARAAATRGVPGAAAEPTVQTNAPGAAHVAEQVRKLAVHTGVYRPLSRPSDIGPTDSPPTIPRQN